MFEIEDHRELLKLNNVGCGYINNAVLENLNMVIIKGEICSIIGEEGAGKSTLLKAIVNQIRRSGEIVYNGISLEQIATRKMVKYGIDFVVQGGNILNGFTVEEHIRLALSEKTESEKRMIWLEIETLFPKIKVLRKQIAGRLSGGERMILSMACVVATKADFVILDEPTAGLAPETCEVIKNFLLEIKNEKGKTVLVLEHNYDFVFDVSDSVMILKEGKLSKKYKEHEFRQCYFIDTKLYGKMKLHTINTGFFKLDGGAMFGVVPKSMWNKLNPADENNMCKWAMRCLLVESNERVILIDTGIGNKQSQDFFDRYSVDSTYTIETSLEEIGLSSADITDIFLTHLHFDHCGGSVKWNVDKTKYELTFPNATYWVSKRQWDQACDPNKREAASFLKENFLPIQESGHLKFLGDGGEIIPGFTFISSNGHTQGMLLPKIKIEDKTICFMADLIPSASHISLPYVMAFDMFPLVTLQEKEAFLNEAVDLDYVLFLEHDPEVECCSVERTDKGFKLKNKFALESMYEHNKKFSTLNQIK